MTPVFLSIVFSFYKGASTYSRSALITWERRNNQNLSHKEESGQTDMSAGKDGIYGIVPLPCLGLPEVTRRVQPPGDATGEVALPDSRFTVTVTPPAGNTINYFYIPPTCRVLVQGMIKCTHNINYMQTDNALRILTERHQTKEIT